MLNYIRIVKKKKLIIILVPVMSKTFFFFVKNYNLGHVIFYFFIFTICSIWVSVFTIKTLFALRLGS